MHNTIAHVHPSWFDVLTDPVRLDIIHSLCVLGSATIAELLSHSHASDRTLRRHLSALVALGVVRERPGESDGESTGRPATRFALDARARQSSAELFRVLEQPLGPWPRRAPSPSRGRGRAP